MIIVWYTVMMKLSARAVARTLLTTFETHKPLTTQEAEQVRLALEESGVTDAATRLNATWSQILLKQVTQ